MKFLSYDVANSKMPFENSQLTEEQRADFPIIALKCRRALLDVCPVVLNPFDRLANPASGFVLAFVNRVNMVPVARGSPWRRDRAAFRLNRSPPQIRGPDTRPARNNGLRHPVRLPL